MTGVSRRPTDGAQHHCGFILRNLYNRSKTASSNFQTMVVNFVETWLVELPCCPMTQFGTDILMWVIFLSTISTCLFFVPFFFSTSVRKTVIFVTPAYLPACLPACLPVCLPARQHGTSNLPLDGFSWNCIFGDFSKIFRENSSFIKYDKNNWHFI